MEMGCGKEIPVLCAKVQPMKVVLSALEMTGSLFRSNVLDEEKSEWYVTPNKSFSDFTSLGNLPETTVRAHASYTPVADGTEAEVTLINESDHLAFFIESRIVGSKSQQTLLPVLWDDNYVSILPGAHKTIRAHLPPMADNEKPELRLQGWNVKFDGAN